MIQTELFFSSKSDDWATPLEFFRQLDYEFNFSLDPCCTTLNCKCSYGYYKDEGIDGLSQDWYNDLHDKPNYNVYMNPPYGKSILYWIEKAYIEWQKGCTVVALLPARTDTDWFHRFIYGKAEVRFIKGRLKFGGSKNSAPFPSMIVIFKQPSTRTRLPQRAETGETSRKNDG